MKPRRGKSLRRNLYRYSLVLASCSFTFFRFGRELRHENNEVRDGFVNSPISGFAHGLSVQGFRTVRSKRKIGSNQLAEWSLHGRNRAYRGEPNDVMYSVSTQRQSSAQAPETIELSVQKQGPEGGKPRKDMYGDDPRTIRTAGLSKFHRRMLSTTTMKRQRFVTGRYPMTVKVEENPTKKWLGLGRDNAPSTSRLLVNGTSIDRSLASYDRFQWLDDEEREVLHNRYDMVSLELLAEIHCKKPAYLNIMPSYGAGSTAAARRAAAASPRWDRWKRNRVLFEMLDESMRQESGGDRLWVTGFSLTKRRGDLFSIDSESGKIQSVNRRTQNALVWPNEVNSVPAEKHNQMAMNEVAVTRADKRDEAVEDSLLLSDGFLVPGRDKGGLYIVRNPGSEHTEWTISLTEGEEADDGWFYHRASWVSLTGDGRKSILSARAKSPSILSTGSSKSNTDKQSAAKTQLVWLERPKPHRIDEGTGTPLEKDGTVFDPFSSKHMPWKVRVLDEGPDVMFCVADMDVEDDSIEILSSQFFSKKVKLHSIKCCDEPHKVYSKTIDENCGAAFGAVLANLDNALALSGRTRSVIDSGSTVTTLRSGDTFSHLLVTSHECSSSSEHDNINVDRESTVHGHSGSDASVDGGALFAYAVPSGKGSWKTKPWSRTVLATGFHVKPQLRNAINPGAPGFCYTFYPKREPNTGIWKQPLIAVAGDCAESAYLFRPITSQGDHPSPDQPNDKVRYALMCEIQCGATVGSIAIGYDDFCGAEQEHGYAKIYVPCYEKDKIFVFGMGSGEDESVADSDW